MTSQKKELLERQTQMFPLFGDLESWRRANSPRIFDKDQRRSTVQLCSGVYEVRATDSTLVRIEVHETQSDPLKDIIEEGIRPRPRHMQVSLPSRSLTVSFVYDAGASLMPGLTTSREGFVAYDRSTSTLPRDAAYVYGYTTGNDVHSGWEVPTAYPIDKREKNREGENTAFRLGHEVVQLLLKAQKKEVTTSDSQRENGDSTGGEKQ